MKLSCSQESAQESCAIKKFYSPQKISTLVLTVENCHQGTELLPLSAAGEGEGEPQQVKRCVYVFMQSMTMDIDIYFYVYDPGYILYMTLYIYIYDSVCMNKCM